MALTITLPELAVAVRVHTDPTAAVAEPHNSILTRLLAVSQAVVESYADGAPDEVKNEAAILLVGYLYDAPPAQRSPSNAFTNSGAKALLAPWHSLGAELISDETTV